MKKIKVLRSTVIATVVGGFLFGRGKRAITGKKDSIAKTVKYDYPFIDTASGKVIGVVIYKGNRYMTVKVDVHTNTYEVSGSMKGFETELQMTEEECIDHIRQRAKLFVDKVAV
ncbi:hypothetical protein ACIQ2D_11835 [Lysinibacillus sp. NPDC097287]|uniref:hypothetical protein n=1 Tax=Lysinibacillus sp. NPDC097287 TaxID=3364144 RepID=UPI0037FA7A04